MPKLFQHKENLLISGEIQVLCSHFPSYVPSVFHELKRTKIKNLKLHTNQSFICNSLSSSISKLVKFYHIWTLECLESNNNYYY